MQKISDIAGSQANTQGEFIETNSDHPGTIVKADWLNTIQREYLGLVESFGGKLDLNDDAQIAKVLDQITPFDAPPNVKGLTGGPNPLYFPEALTENKTIHLFDTKEGACAVSFDQWFLWRNVWKFNTSDYSLAERTFPMESSQTYHVRWQPLNGFSMRSLTDSQYNPQGLAEIDLSFDSSYDDMLVAKVQTDANNQPRFISLVNQQQLRITSEASSFWSTRNTDDDKLYFKFEPQTSLTINWARTPYPFLNQLGGYDISRRMNIDVESRGMPQSNLQYFGTSASRYAINIYDYLQQGDDEIRWTVQAII